MNFVPFGSTGVHVSQMCLGSMMFGERCDEAESRRVVDTALAHDVSFIDTASMYGSGATEEILGRILLGRRDSVFLTTKVNVPTGPEYPARIETSLDESLARLQTDYVDLFLLHWAREHMNPLAIMEKMNAVVQAGKTRFIGCSNFPAWLVAHFNAIAAQNGWAKLINNQVPYNLIERGVEVEVLPQAVAEKIAITCYRPMMAGVLSGKYHPDQPLPEDARGQSDERIPVWLHNHAAGIRALHQLAAGHGVPVSHVAIAWLKMQPGVTCPIIGVSRAAQLEDAIAAFSFDLSPAEAKALATVFNSEVKEVSQSYGPLRRSFELLAH